MSYWWSLLGLPFWCVNFKSSHCTSFEDRTSVGFICGLPINLQTICRNWATWQGTRTITPMMSTRGHAQLMKTPCDVAENVSLNAIYFDGMCQQHFVFMFKSLLRFIVPFGMYPFFLLLFFSSLWEWMMSKDRDARSISLRWISETDIVTSSFECFLNCVVTIPHLADKIKRSSTAGVRRSACVIMMVADVLAPDRRQAISNHHANSVVKLLSRIILHNIHIALIIKQTIFERDPGYRQHVAFRVMQRLLLISILLYDLAIIARRKVLN